MRRTSWKFGTGWPRLSGNLILQIWSITINSAFFIATTTPEPPMDLPYIESFLIFCVCKWCDFTRILLRSHLFISSSQTSGLCCKGFFKVYMSSWTTTVPFLLPTLKVCMSQVPDVLNRSLWGQSPTLRHLYSHLPAMTANSPCCQMPWQLCQNEG